MLFHLFFFIANFILDLLDFSELNELTTNLPTFSLPRTIQFVAYFINGKHIKTLIVLQSGWLSFKMGWAVILRVKSFIPFFSST